MMKMKELGDGCGENYMNREVNMNLDGGEPEEQSPHFPSKLEAALYLQIFVNVERT